MIRTATILLLPVTLLATTPQTQAQTPERTTTRPPQRLIGGVVRTADERPVVGAVVSLDGTLLTTSTDRSGHFELRTEVDGMAAPVLVVSREGYTTQELTLPAVTTGDVAVVLQPVRYDFSQTTFAASRREENVAKAPVTLNHLTDADLRRDPAAVDLFAALARRRGVDQAGNSLLLSQLSTRGFNSGYTSRMVQLTDYADTQSPTSSYNLGNLQGASPLDVQSVDLIHGPAAALYGVGAFNGVVAVTTKDPFQTPGFTAELRGGGQALQDAQVRFARRLGQRVAFKINAGYTQGQDWLATNADAQSQRLAPGNHAPGDARGYDAVNRYGDVGYTYGAEGGALQGQRVFMPGWSETRVVGDDAAARSLRLNPSLSVLLSPRLRATYEYRFTQSTATLQNATRYRLDDVRYHLHRLELRAPAWSLRAYTARDNSGGTYDMTMLGALLQNVPDPSTGGQLSYAQHYFQQYAQSYNAYRQQHPADDAGAYRAAQQAAEAIQLDGYSPAFEQLRQQVAYDATPGRGARLGATSSLTDVSGQYELPWSWAQVLVGGAYRRHVLRSGGTLFADATGPSPVNEQVGGYAEAHKALWDRRLRVTAAARLDAFRHFQPAFSPRLAAVWLLGAQRQHVLRASFGQAYNAPTQMQQYLHLDAGAALVLGNVGTGFQGYDPAVLSGAAPAANVVTIRPLRLERVHTYELGYRALLNQRLLLDATVFDSDYDYFVDSRALVGKADGTRPTAAELATAGQPGSPVRLIQTWYNEEEVVGVSGGTLGAHWFAAAPLTLWGNYTLAYIDEAEADDVARTFNTPRHKANAGVSVTKGPLLLDVAGHWNTGHYFSSGFAEGYLPARTTLDAQLAVRWQAAGLTLKAGGNNLTNARNVQLYGGPQLGRLLYAGIRVDLP